MKEEEIEAVAALFSRAHATLTFLPKLHTAEDDLAFWRNVLMPDSEIWVAERDRIIAGIMALRDDWISQLQVDPEKFRQGTGSALVRHAQSLRDDLQLWCFQENRAARALYEKHGFTSVQFTNGEGNEEKTPDVRYVWRR
jgi:ribosomal protein S18 acetylase RimI-like enzyme